MKSIVKFMLALVLLAPASQTIAAEHPAQILVKDLVEQVLSLAKKDSNKFKEDENYFRRQIDKIVFPHIDIDRMTSGIVGKNWKKATDSQKKELINQFKIFLLNTYAVAINELEGGEVTFEPFRETDKKHLAIVRSHFSGSMDFPVNYHLIKEEEWKIVNLIVSKHNLVVNYRTQFANIVSKDGVDGLIARLKEKNQ